MTLTFAPIRDKIERAARNGERLHLDPAQVRALVKSPIYAKLCEMTAEEFASQWHDDPAPAAQETTTPPASSSAHSGSGIAPIATTGTSAGMSTGPMAAAVERAERAQAWEAVGRKDSPRKKRSMP